MFQAIICFLGAAAALKAAAIFQGLPPSWMFMGVSVAAIIAGLLELRSWVRS